MPAAQPRHQERLQFSVAPLADGKEIEILGKRRSGAVRSSGIARFKSNKTEKPPVHYTFSWLSD
jgi:hypothetical protein